MGGLEMIAPPCKGRGVQAAFARESFGRPPRAAEMRLAAIHAGVSRGSYGASFLSFRCKVRRGMPSRFAARLRLPSQSASTC